MEQIITQWNEWNFNFVYNQLNKMNYKYTLDGLERDFSIIVSEKKFCYLLYLLSKERTPYNAILICDFLLYTNTFFYDIHPVIKMILCQALIEHKNDLLIINWIVDVYEDHPDSPFSNDEINLYKTKRNSLSNQN